MTQGQPPGHDAEVIPDTQSADCFDADASTQPTMHLEQSEASHLTRSTDMALESVPDAFVPKQAAEGLSDEARFPANLQISTPKTGADTIYTFQTRFHGKSAKEPKQMAATLFRMMACFTPLLHQPGPARDGALRGAVIGAGLISSPEVLSDVLRLVYMVCCPPEISCYGSLIS